MLLRKEAPGFDEILTLARWLHNKFPGRTARQAVDAYLSITAIIQPMSSTTEYEHSCTEAGHLVGMLAALYGAALPLDDETWAHIKARRDAIDARFERRDPANVLESYRRQVDATNILRLSTNYQKRVALNVTIHSQFNGRNPTPLNCPDDVAAQADLAAQRLASLRGYGVPSCIMQDGIMHDRDKCWAFYDGHAVMAQFPERFQAGLRMPLAFTFLATRDKIRSLNTTVKPTDVSEDHVMFSVGFPYKALIVVHLDGELTLDTEYGLLPLKHAFEEAGKAEFYDVFRFVHLMRLCDLLIPETVKRERGIRNWPAVGSGKDRKQHRQEVEELYREFLVPRQHVIYEGDFAASLDAEMRKSEPLPREIGTVREQLGYFKPLPAGCVASPEACKLALEEKGDLPPEGHTYVRTHPHWYRGAATVIPVAKRRQRRTEE
jgi:hypothetical protein